jgi:hypothetical protein
MKTNRIKILVAVILIIIVFTLCHSMIKSCFWWECGKHHGFSITDLALDKNLLPPEVVVTNMQPLSHMEGTREDAFQSILLNNQNAIAIYYVLRYPSIRIANEKFETKKDEFREKESKSVWPPDDRIKFLSKGADKYFIGCGNRSEYECVFVAQYQDYLVVFISEINQTITHSIFNSIICNIDQVITEELYPE